MTILVTGSTGAIGAQVVNHLASRGAKIKALVRSPEKARFPEGVEVVQGDMIDIDSMRAALTNISTLFLLNAVTPEEMTQGLIALNLAHEAGIKRVVYFSVIHSDIFTNVPHFTGKYSIERMLAQLEIPATILRPAYFTQNDASLKEAIVNYGVYPMPVGESGVAMIDTRDIAEIAALELLRRENASGILPSETLDLVGPELLTGPAIANIWSSVLQKVVHYGGDDLTQFEQNFRHFAPAWMAYDMRVMMDRIQREGMVGASGADKKLEALLGRPLRTYHAFAEEMARQWAQ